MTTGRTGSYLSKPAVVSMVANRPGILSTLREIKATRELAGPNFIDVHIPHSLGGLQSKWKESNILLY